MTIPRVSAPRRRIAVTAVALAFSAPAFSQSVTGSTLPTGGQVVGGQASISQSGAAMSVQQTSAHAAIDWQSFSIGSQASVTFSQPSASAIALNRVVGANGSEILGRLSANGQVFLVNPNGILFGRGAQVSVGGLLASTLDMSSADFMAGRYALRGGNGSVVNQGDIRAAPKGYVALVGSSVTNDGTIESPAGTVTLAAGTAATLDFMADGLVKLRVDEGALRAEVSNSGFIQAQDGSVFLSAKSVDSLARSVVNNTGIVEAQGVKILGDVVVLSGAARIDASAEGGGGEVLIGGNYQGKGPEQNAARTYVGPDVTIAADAIGSGDGGRVIVWGDEATYFHGAISARGGEQSGNGGFVETSGSTLRVTGTVDTDAPRGTPGSWLLDPKFITVAALGQPLPLDGQLLFDNNLDGLTVVDVTSINDSASNVLLQANTDVVFDAPVTMSKDAVSLTAQAGRSILVNQSIRTTNGDVTLIANDPGANAIFRDPGAGGITMAPDTTIDAGSAKATLWVRTGVIGGAGPVPGGDIVAANITAKDIELQQRSLTSASILRAASNSLLSGTNLLLEIDSSGQASGGSIGTSAAPMRIQVDRLEAHTHETSAGIFIDSPNPGNLEIGDVPFFVGSVKGVQTESGGDIRLDVNGNLTQRAGTAACGSTGGTGGPICAVNGTLTLSASGDVTLNSQVSSVASNPGAAANVSIDGASVLLSASGNIFAIAADGGSASSSTDVFANGGSASVDLLATGAIITDGGITAAGGDGGDATSTAGNAFASGGTANVTLNTGAGDIAVGGVITLTGGFGGSANASVSGVGGADGGSAFLELFSSGGTGGAVTTNGTLGLAGGLGGTAAGGVFASARGGDTDSFIGSTTGEVAVNAGYFGQGGAGGSASSSGGSDADGGFAGLVISTSGKITVGFAGTRVIAGDGGVGSFRGGDADTILEHDAGGPGGSGPFLAAGDIILNGSIDVTSGGGAFAGDAGVFVNGASVTANGVSVSASVGSGGGIQSADVEILGDDVTLQPGSSISANGVNNASVSIDAALNATLRGTIDVTATAPAPAGIAAALVNAGGNVTLGADISVLGAGTTDQAAVPAGVRLVAGGQIISEGGVLTAVRSGPGGETYVDMTAQTGIGTPLDPVRIFDPDAVPPTGPIVLAQNLGATGDIAISFNLAGGELVIGGPFSDFRNNAPDGSYFLRMEQGNITLTAPFQPDVPLFGNQGVVFETPTGDINLLSGAAIQTAGSGGITLTAGDASHTGNINVIADTAPVVVQSGGLMTVSATGTLTLQGGSGAGWSASLASAGGQIITAGGDITIIGGDGAGGGNSAQIYNVGTAGQEVAADGFITIAGGAVGGGNSAKIQTENGEQRITAEGISLTGGADGGGSGTGNFALISSGGTLTTTPGNQVIDVGAAGLLLQGGGGALTDNFAIINQPGPAGTSQTITVSAGGQILLLGGSSAQSDVGSPHGSYAVIQSTGSAQLIDFTAGGALSLTGGTVGTRNFAIVAATTGDQTITGSPTITLVGGASGGTNAENNGAQIQANAGTQTIVAGATALTAGAGGMSNHATLSAPTQLITVHGNLALTGGNSSPGTTGAGARIGGLGGASPTPTVLTLIVDGNVDLVGGGVAGASGSAIGSASLATPQPTTIDMQVGGNLTLTAGAVSGVRIGSPIANIAGGDILVDVGGDVTLDDNGVIRGAVIATTGNLDLSAGAFMGQTALSRIEVNTLDANAGTGISLNGDNLVAVFNASNSGGSGGVQLVNGGPLNIAGITNGGTGNVVVINDGPITISGPIVDAPAGVLLQSTGAITETGAGSITTGGTLTVQGDGGIVLEGANSVLAFSADNATGGNVSFVNTSPTLTVAAVTQTGSGTVSVAHTGGMLVAGVDGGAGPVSLTATGNMLIAGDVQTTDAGASAIILSAGHGTTAGTATGGDLLIGANVIVGPGGRATLFTGSIAGSTFGSLVPSGSGNFRYNSSPTTTNYTAPLGSGIYAIYREQPTLTITAGSPTAITYGTPPGAFSFTVDGFENGDTAAQALSTPPTIADDGVVSTSGNLTVGTHAVTASGAVDQLGYAIGYVAGTLTVDPLTVTASGITANNKVYDATTAATLNTGSLSGLITNDVVTVSATGTFIDRHAGIGKTVNISGASLSGTDAGNYVLSSTTGTTTADITPRPLTVTAQADSKVYDQTTVSAVVPQITLGALQGADTATFVQTFDTKNVGTGKTLTASGAVSDGNGGNNYALTFAAANTGVITAKPISAAGIVANSKVYDQTATATLNFSGATVAGGASNAGDNLYYTGDVVALDATSATGAFADKNAGTAKPIAIAGLALTGTDAGNYTLNPAVVSANITPKAITATGITAASRTYDATASASVNTTGAAITGGASGATDNRFYTGDTVMLDASGAVGVFADKNVGTAKPVTVTGLALSGADAGNYLVSDASGATADITAAGITSVTGIIANDKIHDGTTDATLNTSATVFNGRLASDVLTVASAVASFQDPDIGTDKPVDISAITLGGADAGNYVLLSTTASAIADILPVPPAPAPVAPGFEPSTVIASTMSEGATGPSEPAASNVDLSISVLPVDMAPLASRPALDPAGAQFAPKTWQLLSDLWELRRKKRLAIEEAVRILERNPNAADLPSCGAQASGECIAEPSGQRANVRAQPTPKLAHFPEIIRKVALLIGVSDYQGAIPKLDSPLKDVAEVGKLYGERFGYEVRMLGNADKTAIVRELNRLILESGPNDSVTVFYAGHGHVVEKTGRGYWIPAKASADDPTQWISNQDIGKFLANIPAKQILLVSDSCYSGTLTRDAKVAKAEVASEASAVLERRSVTVLSSGGEEPVADSGKDGHSVFAWHLMRNLRDVGSWSKGVDVHEQVAEKVRQDFPQQPQYGAATGSGHEAGGDFLFEVRRY